MSMGESKMHTQRRSKRMPIKNEGMASAKLTSSGRNEKKVSTRIMLKPNMKNTNNCKTQRDVGGN